MMNTTEFAESERVATNANAVVKMPLGLLGFEQIKEYLLLSSPEEEPFLWLQVAGDPGLAFLVISPFEVLPSYKPEVDAQDVAFLELTSPADALIYNIVTLKGQVSATVNLKGPIIINRRTLKAKQVILSNASVFALKHPVSVAGN